MPEKFLRLTEIRPARRPAVNDERITVLINPRHISAIYPAEIGTYIAIGNPGALGFNVDESFAAIAAVLDIIPVTARMPKP